MFREFIDMSSTLKIVFTGTGALAASNALARAVSFIGVVVVTHVLSLYEYGIVTLVLAISGPVLAVVNLGLDELVIAEVARFRSESALGNAKRLQLSYFSMQWGILICVLIGGFLLHTVLLKRYGPALQEEALALIAYIIVQVLRTSSVTFLNAHKQFVTIAWLGTLEPVMRVALIGVFATTHKLIPSTTLYAYALGSLLTVVATIPQCIRIMYQYRTVTSPRGFLLWKILKGHGKWQGILVILSSILSNIKYYIIKLLLSTEAVSIFSVAQSMFSAIASLVPLKTVVSPLLAERVLQLPRLRLFVAKASKYTFLVYSLVTVAVMVAAPFFITLFFPKYQASILIFEIMALRFPFNTFSLMQAPILIALRDQKFLSRVSITNGMSLIIFAPLLINLLGLPGAAIEGIITILIVVIQREYRLRKAYGVPTWNFRALWTFDAHDREVLRAVLSFLLTSRIVDRLIKR